MFFRKVVLSAAGGAVIGWFGHTEINKHLNNNNSVEPIDFMSSNYKATPWDSNWDRRAPAALLHKKQSDKLNGNNVDVNNNQVNGELKKVTPTASRHLILIRHGQYNLDGSTDSGRTLTQLGKDQADGTAKRLVELGFPYTSLTHSSMTRARETANIVHKHLPDLPIVECDLLCEGAPFPSEPPLRNWKADYKFYTDGARIEAAFRKYFHRADPKQTIDSYEIIVCHANVIRYFVCRALQLPPEAWLRMSLYHASLTMFTIRPNGNVALRTVSDAGHLSPNMLTTS